MTGNSPNRHILHAYSLKLFFPCFLTMVVGLWAQESTTKESAKFSTEDNGRQIILKKGKSPILVYNYQVVSPPKGIDKLYARSGHIHPIYSPAGKVVTDDFSDDHAHQHGLFNAFVKARVEGESLDFWNQHKKTANVKFSAIADSRVGAKISTRQIHYRLRDEKTIFEEQWTIKPVEHPKCFVFDLHIKITNATDKPVTVEKNHYGSFGLRGSGQWRKVEASAFDFSTASGKDRKTGNQSREEWVAMHGKIDGQLCGIAVLGHPSNFRHPQPARLHPTMPYFSFAPMSLGSFDMKPGASMTTQFRIVTFDGKLDRKLMDSLMKR